MVIDNIQIRGFLKIREASYELDGVTLFAGPNGSGKSSIADAIAFALTGQPSRGITLKRDTVQLLSDGHKKGSIILDMSDGNTIRRNIVDRKGSDALIEESYNKHQAIPFVTDMHAFMRLDQKERRTWLFRLFGLSIEGKWVLKRLMDMGFNTDAINRVIPVYKSGFPAMENTAKDYIKEQRAIWCEITQSPRFGSKIAEEWEPELDPKAREASEEKVKPISRDLEGSQEMLKSLYARQGKAIALIESATGIHERIAKLEPVARMFAGRQDALREVQVRKTEAEQVLTKGREDLRIARANLTAAQQGFSEQTKTAPHWPCPNCATKLRYDKKENALVLFQHGKPEKPVDLVPFKTAVEEASMEEKRLIGELNAWNRQIETARGQMQESDSAAKTLDELREIAEQETPTSTELEEVKANIAKVSKLVDQQVADLSYWRELIEKKARAKETADRAGKALRLIESYEGIAKACSANGLPKELIGAALDPFNATLKRHTDVAKFPPMRLHEDMRLSIGQHDYNLCSESYQWRANAVCAAAIAEHSGVGFVVLDRFDVLDIPSRGAALGWLYGVRDSVQSLVMGTLKSLPSATGGMACYWLGDDDG